jgi:hypothetical protein
MKEILVMPDPHDNPAVNKDRFTWAAEFALKRQPDYIICMGDFAEMGSLCSYEKGKVAAEGLRYCDDIASAHKALATFNKPIDDYNNLHTKWKMKMYRPKKIMLLGNHENRINIAAQCNPNMYGTLKVEDLKYAEHGWEVYPFLKPAVVEDIAFVHYLTSGIMGRPTSGVNHARSLIMKGLSSACVAHSHMRDMSEQLTVTGRKMLGIVAGCFFEHQMLWSSENDRYWRGLVYLHDVHQGQAEPEFLNLETYLKKKYS